MMEADCFSLDLTDFATKSRNQNCHSGGT